MDLTLFVMLAVTLLCTALPLVGAWILVANLIARARRLRAGSIPAANPPPE